jgi:hypothetical protein
MKQFKAQTFGRSGTRLMLKTISANADADHHAHKIGNMDDI